VGDTRDEGEGLMYLPTDLVLLGELEFPEGGKGLADVKGGQEFSLFDGDYLELSIDGESAEVVLQQ
jgi:hypothetical protein